MTTMTIRFNLQMEHFKMLVANPEQKLFGWIRLIWIFNLFFDTDEMLNALTQVTLDKSVF